MSKTIASLTVEKSGAKFTPLLIYPALSCRDPKGILSLIHISPETTEKPDKAFAAKSEGGSTHPSLNSRSHIDCEVERKRIERKRTGRVHLQGLFRNNAVRISYGPFHQGKFLSEAAVRSTKNRGSACP